jgi:hypothetical protein
MTRQDTTRHDMTRHEGSGPLSRIVSVDRLRRSDGRLVVTASPEECAALAADFKIPAIRDLLGTFETSGPPSAFRVRGTVTAQVTQVCTVSLEAFEGPVSEPVDLLFTDTYPRKPGVAFEPHIEYLEEPPLAALRGLKPAND